MSAVALASLSFLLLATFWAAWERARTERIGGDILHEKREDFRRLIHLSSDPIRTTIFDYSHWDELAKFSQRPDAEWAASNLDSVLESIEIDGLWVVDERVRVRHEVFLGDGTVRASTSRILAEVERHLRSGRRDSAFFLALPHGVTEVFVASIHLTGDTEGRGPRFGALVFARTWTPAVLDRLSEISNARLAIVPTRESGKLYGHLDSKLGVGHYWIPLPDPNGRPAAYLTAASAMPVIAQLDETGTRALVASGIFAFTILALLLGTLWRYVRRPLVRLISTLRDGRLERLDEIREAGTEFDALARVVEQVYAQRAELEAYSHQLEAKVKDRTRELERQASSDALTGLVNRKHFVERLNAEFELGRETGQALALAFIDLDDFKQVNDTLGHEAGDRLLIEVAERLRACVRADDIVARLGGDEFTIVLRGVRGPEDLENLAARLNHQLSQVVEVGAGELTPRASIGMAWGIPGILTSEELLRNADLAMYEAKAGGKGRHAIFHDDLLLSYSMRLQNEVGLRAAIEQGQLTLHYQPIVDLGTGEARGYEALTRWIHPTRGMIPPSEFIPVAEQSGLIHQLGAWVIREACRQVREWADQGLATDFYVSVNLSNRQLADPDLVGRVEQCLQEWDVPAARIQIEVTESTVMEDPDSAIRRLSALRAMGLRIAIDDFGTGQSSFAALHDLPADTVKLDRVFVADLAVSKRSEAITRAIIEVCRQLRLSVTAEGIETADQRQILHRLGCHSGQGYLFGRPVAAQEVHAVRRSDDDLSPAA